MTSSIVMSHDALVPASLPIGTVTFMFTDIEGSTRLLQELGADYQTCWNATLLSSAAHSPNTTGSRQH